MNETVKKIKAYAEQAARQGAINNSAVGQVTNVANDGRYTVRLDGGRTIKLFSTGETFIVGDTVGITFMGADKRQAQITGKTTRRLATSIRQVWR